MELCGQFLGRATQILTLEGIPTNNNTKKALAELIMKHAPDWRRVLNECQRGSMGGALVLKESVTSNSSNYDSLFLYLKNKDFKKMRSWVVNNMDVDVAAIFRAIYDRMYDKVQPHSIPQLVLILADYQYKNAFVADHELNVVACLTEIMADVEVT